MADARERDELEPPGVSTGKVLAAVAAVFGLLFSAIVLMSLFYEGRVRGSVEPTPHALPAPQLETSSNPRLTADRGHGPEPYRERPVDQRAEERGAAFAVARRGR